MERSNNRLNIMQNAIHIIGMTLAISIDFNGRMALKIPWIVIMLSACMIYIIIWLVEYNKKNMITYIALAGILVLSSLFIGIRKINVVYYIVKLKDWFFSYLNKKEEYHITYAFAIILIFIAMITIVCYLIQQNYFVWRIVLTCILVFLVYSMVVGININKITLFILLIFILQMGIELNHKIYKKDVLPNRAINIFLLPLCIIIGIAAVCLPSNESPIQWKSVKTFFSVVSNTVDDIVFYITNFESGFGGEYSLSFVGYTGEDGDLGGEVQDSNRIILTATTTTGAYDRTYLTGNISDVYTSKGWKRSDIDFLSNRETDVEYYEMLYGMYQNGLQPPEDEVIVHPLTLHITYKNIKTKTILYPKKLNKYQPIKSKVMFNGGSPVMKTSKLLKKGFQYQMNFYEINYDSDTIKNYLRDISNISRTKNKYYIAEYYSRNKYTDFINEMTGMAYFDTRTLNDQFSDLLNRRMDVIEHYYTNVPEQVPDRVYTLARDITKPYNNNYDKLKALERYLADFSYTKTPSKTPEDEEFVDYFLFNQKEGYCTYFATTLAIMGRCIGIPTRYVEGVVLDYKTKKGKDYLVNSNDSHAWMEAYIEGFGWVPFEATPSMQQVSKGKWRKVEKTVGAAIPMVTPPPTYAPNSNNNIDVIKIQQKEQSAFYFLRLCIVIILLISASFIIIILLFSYNKKRKYKRATLDEKIKLLIGDILEYLKLDGYQRKATETLTDFTLSLKESYRMNQLSFQEVVIIYEEIRYGGKEAEITDVKQLEAYHNLFGQYMKNKLGRIKMLLYCVRILMN